MTSPVTMKNARQAASAAAATDQPAARDGIDSIPTMAAGSRGARANARQGNGGMAANRPLGLERRLIVPGTRKPAPQRGHLFMGDLARRQAKHEFARDLAPRVVRGWRNPVCVGGRHVRTVLPSCHWEYSVDP